MPSKDSLGDRMKGYEKRLSTVLLPQIPVIARIDGRAFHTFAHGLRRPYDERLTNLMVETTKFLVESTNACCGYTQSDEISLLWLAETCEDQLFFGGKQLKMVSVIASIATAYFNRHLAEKIPEKSHLMAFFDNRVWQVPSPVEGCNYLVWREQDATRNSISMAARALYSHKECHSKDSSELQEMLWQKGVNWNDYPGFFKRGTYVRRRQIDRPFTAEELEELPPKHHAHGNPELTVRRTAVMAEDFPPITKIVNRVGVIFHGEEPALGE